MSGLKSINVEKKKLKDLQEVLKRIGMNTNCNVQYVNTKRVVTHEEFELIRLIADNSSDQIHISPKLDDDDQCNDKYLLYPNFDQCDYNVLNSICAKCKEVCVEYECDSLSVEEWIKIRQKMLSREFFLTYLLVFVGESIASSILFAIHGVKFESKKLARGELGIKFYSNEDGKKIFCRHFDGKCYVCLFDGLFSTEFCLYHCLDYNLNRVRMTMKWYKDEKELKMSRDDYMEKTLKANSRIPPSKKRFGNIYVMVNYGIISGVLPRIFGYIDCHRRTRV
ncbi:hypothetical protein PFISCL1PPCAC_19217 [Pristionchus fissidentatus]|uniref:Uncharacterized protein n=1 Tax=Pristionchus fissidentatus TaxID=1538716 RepID=A0AAV5W862_9BILA|nr:hypothetical protein PFISCL1PPCAC_19217 [Pristionchus fissidentatus]